MNDRAWTTRQKALLARVAAYGGVVQLTATRPTLLCPPTAGRGAYPHEQQQVSRLVRGLLDDVALIRMSTGEVDITQGALIRQFLPQEAVVVARLANRRREAEDSITRPAAVKVATEHPAAMRQWGRLVTVLHGGLPDAPVLSPWRLVAGKFLELEDGSVRCWPSVMRAHGARPQSVVIGEQVRAELVKLKLMEVTREHRSTKPRAGDSPPPAEGDFVIDTAAVLRGGYIWRMATIAATKRKKEAA